MRRASLFRLCWLLAALGGPIACRPLLLEDVQFGGVRAQLPEWAERKAEGGPGAGALQRSSRPSSRSGQPPEPGAGRVSLSWEADARTGLPADDEAWLTAALGPEATLLEPARQALGKGAAGPEVQGHAAALIEAGSARALVWRCDKTGRLLRLSREGTAPGSVSPDELIRMLPDGE